MRKIAFFAAAVLAFGLAPEAARVGPVPGALLLVGIAVLLAVAASGALTSLAVAGGALGAFAGGVLAPVSPAAAGAVFAGLCFAERSTRVRSRSARCIHVAVALGGGALSCSLATSFAASSLAIRGVSLVVASVLVALPLLIEADDPVAHALDGAAEEITGPARASLQEGAELRRTIDEDLLEKKTAQKVRATWASLLRLSEARARLERSSASRRAKGKESGEKLPPPSPAEAVMGKVDARIAEHVAALTRAYSAADAARAAEMSLDDAALRGVETAGESLEQVSRAIVEDV
jgi:hypothetical protein